MLRTALMDSQCCAECTFALNVFLNTTTNINIFKIKTSVAKENFTMFLSYGPTDDKWTLLNFNYDNMCMPSFMTTKTTMNM